MADNCCNPVTPESCVHKCDKLVDACCVINEDELSCIIPSITVIDVGVSQGVTSFGDAGFSVLPNPFYGVITVTSTTPDIFAPNTTVTKIVGNVITIDTPTIGGDKVDVVFTFTEQRQCDINKATNDIICELQQGLAPCKVWNIVQPTPVGPVIDGSFNIGWENLDFSDIPTQDAQYSNVFECEVFLRGFVTGVWLTDPADAYTIFTLPVGFRPSILHVFPTTLSIENSIDPIYDGGTYAASILVFPNGNVMIVWNGKCCGTTIVDTAGGGSTTMRVTLEGVSFTI